MEGRGDFERSLDKENAAQYNGKRKSGGKTMKRSVCIFALLAVMLALLCSASSCVGNYACKTCKDEKRITCLDCKGKKEKTCALCHGDGSYDCALCNGTGRRICISCGGMGGSYQYDYFSKGYTYKSCYSCVGGYTSCVRSSICSCIDGKTTCVACDEDGKIDCPDCSSEE